MTKVVTKVATDDAYSKNIVIGKFLGIQEMPCSLKVRTELFYKSSDLAHGQAFGGVMSMVMACMIEGNGGIDISRR